MAVLVNILSEIKKGNGLLEELVDAYGPNSLDPGWAIRGTVAVQGTLVPSPRAVTVVGI